MSLRQNPAPDPAANLAVISDEIAAALKEAGRPQDAVTITAVAKKHGRARILPALKAGHRVYGENRVQEAAGKWPALKDEFPDIELRLIGPLQSNKAADAVRLFDTIETVDRPKIAKALAREMDRQARNPRLLIQVNVGEEPQKAGILPKDADRFVAQCRDEIGLVVEGLMCIPPINEPPALYFALLAKIAEANGLETLSMGMSSDYLVAAQLGATHVRIGTAIFGPRLDGEPES